MKTFTPDLDPAVLARLREYAARFAPDFPQSKPARWAGVYLHGLLADGERKSIEPMAQRLARRLCAYCKKRTVLKVDRLQGAGFFDAAFDIEAFEPVGCARCGHSGYKGRVGLYEVMTVSDEIREMTIDRTSADVMRTKAVEQGMRLLKDDGLEKVRLGVTSIQEISRVT